LLALKAEIMLEIMTKTCSCLREVFWLEEMVLLAVMEAPAVPKEVPSFFQVNEHQPSSLKKRDMSKNNKMMPWKRAKMAKGGTTEAKMVGGQAQVETDMVHFAPTSCLP